MHVGTPIATAVWSFNGNVLSNSSKYTLTANSTQLVINNVILSDAGVYYCQASNRGGSSTAGINLDVQGINFKFILVRPTIIISNTNYRV